MLIPREVFKLHNLTGDEPRYALGGVQFTREATQEPTAVATDGRCLMAVSWIEGDSANYPNVGDKAHLLGFTTIVPAKACQSASGGLGVKCGSRIKPIVRNVLLEEPKTNGTVSLVATNCATTQRSEPQALIGRFPKWREVIPQRDSMDGVSVEIDPRQLGQLLITAADILGDGSTVILTLPRDGADHTKALTISQQTAGGTNLVGVLMPKCVDGPAPEPRWLAKRPTCETVETEA